MVKISIFSLPDLYALFALVGIEVLLGSEPLVFELFVQSINLWSEGFRVDVFTFDQLSKLILWNYYITLLMSSKKEDLLQVLSDDIAAFD